jgi:hypothetical protein
MQAFFDFSLPALPAASAPTPENSRPEKEMDPTALM